MNSRYWTFAGGLTNFNIILTVTGTQAGAVRTYTNPKKRVSKNRGEMDMGGIPVEERIRVSQDRTLVLQRSGPIPVLRGDTKYVAWSVSLGQGDGVVFAKLNIKNIGPAELALASCKLRIGTRSDESGDIQKNSCRNVQISFPHRWVNSWNANVASQA